MTTQKKVVVKQDSAVEGEYLPKRKKSPKRSESAKRRSEEMQKGVDLGVGIGFGFVIGAVAALRALNQGK